MDMADYKGHEKCSLRFGIKFYGHEEYGHAVGVRMFTSNT